MSTLLHMTAAASVLIAVITILRALFMHRLPKRAFTALWLVAALRLLLPFSLPVPVPVPAEPAIAPAAVTAAAGHTAPAVSTAETAAPAAAAEGLAEHSAAAGTGVFSRTPLLCVVWGCGAALTAAVFFLRHLRWYRRYREAVPADDPIIDSIIRAFPCRRPVRVRICQHIPTPLTYGVLHPVILLPKTLEYADRTQLTQILTHELVHIRRLHIPYKYLLTAAACLHWFSPPAWVMYALANRDLELSCDEAVLRHLEGDRRDYALTLITLAQRQRFTPLSSGFAAGAVKERITNIMKYKKLKLTSAIAATALVLCACAVFVTAYAAPATGDASDTNGPIQYICQTAYYTPEEFAQAMAQERRSIEAEVSDGTLDRDGADSILADIDRWQKEVENGRLIEKAMPVYYADGTPLVNSRGEQLSAKASDIAECNEELAYRYYHPDPEATTVTEDSVAVAAVAEIPADRQAAGETAVSDIQTGAAISEQEPDVHWYTYEEYEDYVNRSKAEYKDMEGEFFFDSFDGWQEWTAEDTAEACARLDETLADIRNGVSIGYTPDGAMILQSGPSEAGTEADFSTVVEDTAIAEEAVSTAVEGSFWEDSLLEDYFSFGIQANSRKQWFEYGGKPIAGFVDWQHRLMTDGAAQEARGIYLSAIRDRQGRLTGVEEVTATEFSRLSGLTV